MIKKLIILQRFTISLCFVMIAGCAHSSPLFVDPAAVSNSQPPSTSEELWIDIKKLIAPQNSIIDATFVEKAFGVIFSAPRSLVESGLPNSRVYSLSNAQISPIRVILGFYDPKGIKGLISVDWGEELGRGFPPVSAAPFCLDLRAKQSEIEALGWRLDYHIPYVYPLSAYDEYSRGKDGLRIFFDSEPGVSDNCMRQLQMFIHNSP